MSSKVDARVTRAERDPQAVSNFDAERVAAPFFLRCGALLIDYILVLIAPVSMMLLGRYFGTDAARLVAGSLNDTGWLIAVLVGSANFVLLPVFSGRSIGKMVTGLRIVSRDGRQAKPFRLLLRQSLGYLVTALTLGAGFLFSALNRSGRTLHDILFGTVVIYADRRLK
ncbi:MAG: RDD family protein [Pyrinomonadaceae bacterium]